MLSMLLLFIVNKQLVKLYQLRPIAFFAQVSISKVYRTAA